MQQRDIFHQYQTLEAKNELILLNLIRTQRNASAITIQQQWKSKDIFYYYLFYPESTSPKSRSSECKLIALLRLVLTQRTQAASLLTRKYKEFIFRRQAKEVIKKSKDYFSIIPIVQSSSKTFEIKIYFKKGKVSTYKLSFCPVRKIYLFDVPRKMVSQLKYKFCFVINGTAMIDPQYPYVYSHGEYFNVINIKELQDKELLREMEYSNQKEKYFSSTSPNSPGVSETNSSSNDSEEDFSDSSSKGFKKSDYKALTPKAKKLQIYGIDGLLNEAPTDDGFRKSSSVKSILKELRSFKMKTSSKHVSFGKVETCCRSLLFI